MKILLQNVMTSESIKTKTATGAVERPPRRKPTRCFAPDLHLPGIPFPAIQISGLWAGVDFFLPPQRPVDLPL
jgi:hypothetical protein